MVINLHRTNRKKGSKSKQRRRPSSTTRQISQSSSKPSNSSRNRRSIIKALKYIFLSLTILLLGYLSINIITLIETYKTLEIKDKSVSPSSFKWGENEDVITTLLVIEDEDSSSGRSISSVNLLAYNQEKGINMAIHIPAWVYVNLAENEVSDKLAVQDLYYLGELINGERGYEYALWEIQNVIGVNADSYIWFTAEGMQVLETNIPEEKGNDYLTAFFNSFSISKFIVDSERFERLATSVYSNLNVVEIYDWVNFNQAIFRSGSAEIIDLTEEKYLLPLTLENGSKVDFYNAEVVDKEIANLYDFLRSRDLEKEQVKVEVYNSSGISGLASRYARKIRNNGCKVIRSDNAPEAYGRYPESVIYVSKLEKFQTSLNLIKNLVPVDAKVVEGRPKFLSTGDIVIVLGEDMESEISF